MQTVSYILAVVMVHEHGLPEKKNCKIYARLIFVLAHKNEKKNSTLAGEIHLNNLQFKILR